MPHAGLMDEGSLGPLEGPLQRARLHIRGGRRRLREGKISAGLATLYDALVAGMEYYLERPEKKASIKINNEDDLKNDRSMFNFLKRSGVLDDSFDFDSFDSIIEDALNRDFPPDFDYKPYLEGIEKIMFELGVMPFDESGLPHEAPNTF